MRVNHWRIGARLALASLCFCAPVAAREIGPDANWCAEINRLAPGEELVLRGGKYSGPCTIRRGGTADAPLVIRASSLADRPWIAYDGRSDNVINIRADHVTLRGLKFGPTQSDVDGVRIFARQGVVVEDCEFAQMGGIAVVANHNSASGLTVRRNRIANSAATALYFGCHDGNECRITDLLVANNFIDGVSAPEPEIGYGIQIKLNSVGNLRDNVILRTKGPGIMVYGSHDPGRQSVIEGNFTSDSRTSSGIVIGGGPAHVVNNISARNREAGIAMQDYAGRGLLKKIRIEHNSIYNNQQNGIAVPAQRAVDAAIANNAVAGHAALPASANGLQLIGNQDCGAGQCFRDAEQLDFTPRGDFLLSRESRRADGSRPPERDFFGAKRPAQPMAGAVERGGGAVLLGIKP